MTKERGLTIAIRIAFAIAVFAAAMTLVSAARAEYKGPPGPYHDWFLAQRTEPEYMGPNSRPLIGPCCGDEEHYGGDGRYVDVRSLPEGHYEVFVKEAGMWMLYPKPVNPDHDNPTGHNVAWYVAYKIEDHWSVNWFCLRLAQGM